MFKDYLNETIKNKDLLEETIRKMEADREATNIAAQKILDAIFGDHVNFEGINPNEEQITIYKCLEETAKDFVKDNDCVKCVEYCEPKPHERHSSIYIDFEGDFFTLYGKKKELFSRMISLCDDVCITMGDEHEVLRVSLSVFNTYLL